MLVALNEIETRQANPTPSTKAKLEYLMDYAATHPDTTVRFHASNMILHVDSDAAYLVLPKVRSQISSYYYLADKPPLPPENPNPIINGAVHVERKVVRNVIASATETETGAFSTIASKLYQFVRH